LVSGLLRISFPTIVKHILYMFELNIRYASVLGLIGAGGIGVLAAASIRNADFNTATAILYLICALVAAVEILSRTLAKRVD
jgi:phosphonate transport system permease protein